LQLSAERPDDSAALHQLGVIAGARMLVLAKQGRHNEAADFGRQAVAYKQRALALDPGNVAYREALAGECNNLARELLGLWAMPGGSNVAEALQWTSLGEATMRALERDDPAAPVWGQRRRYFALQHGRALLANGRVDEALAPLRESIQEMASASAGNLLRRRGWARLELARALGATGAAHDARAALAAALRDLQAVLQAQPDDAEAIALLGHAERQRSG
jgi:tetratricopeptide (TPR) repeat protein